MQVSAEALDLYEGALACGMARGREGGEGRGGTEGDGEKRGSEAHCGGVPPVEVDRARRRTRGRAEPHSRAYCRCTGTASRIEGGDTSAPGQLYGRPPPIIPSPSPAIEFIAHQTSVHRIAVLFMIGYTLPGRTVDLSNLRERFFRRW